MQREREEREENEEEGREGDMHGTKSKEVREAGQCRAKCKKARGMPGKGKNAVHACLVLPCLSCWWFYIEELIIVCLLLFVKQMTR